MSKVLILGDTHGDNRGLEMALHAHRNEGICHTLQVGDFGYVWRGEQQTAMRLEKLARVLNKYAMTMDVVRGNHEDYETMALLGFLPSNHDYFQLSRRVGLIPDAYVWEWEGLTCAALGGASSVDKPGRTEGVDWFPQELISEEAVESLIDQLYGQRLDVLFTHDAPDTQRLLDFLSLSAKNWGIHELVLSDRQRELLNIVVDTLAPRIVIHGHYHWPYLARRGSSIVVGLDLISRSGSTFVLDSETFEDDLAYFMERTS